MNILLPLSPPPPESLHYLTTNPPPLWSLFSPSSTLDLNRKKTSNIFLGIIKSQFFKPCKSYTVKHVLHKSVQPFMNLHNAKRFLGGLFIKIIFQKKGKKYFCLWPSKSNVPDAPHFSFTYPFIGTVWAVYALWEWTWN